MPMRAIGIKWAPLEIREVVVLVAQTPRLRKPHAVDDAGVIELVANDGVFLCQQRLEKAAVRVEATGIKNCVVGAKKLRDRLLEFLVHGLRAADEPYGRHAETVGVETSLRGFDEAAIVRKTEVVVGAEVQHAASVREPDI